MSRGGALREGLRRGAVFGSVLCLHLLLLLFVLHSASYRRGGQGDRRGGSQPLQLWLLPRSPPTAALRAKPLPAAPLASVLTPVTPVPANRTTHRLSAAVPPHGAAESASLLHATPSTNDLPAAMPAARNDGGFQARLEHARHAYAVHGIPGAVTAYVPGIHLIDPATQGISAVARQAQQLFGVANRHCIDVDVWRHLTPRELSERHISPGDMVRVAAENHCNEPPGLHF